VVGIQVADGDGKAIKTASSERFVPIHSLLIKLGFLDYVEQQRQAGHKRLFPELKRDKHHKRFGTSISKKLNHYRKDLGIFVEGKASHSMRHSFDTMLINNDVPVVRVKELMGHEQNGETTNRYYKGAKLQKLKEAIEKIDYGIRLEMRNGEWQICRVQSDD